MESWQRPGFLFEETGMSRNLDKELAGLRTVAKTGTVDPRVMAKKIAILRKKKEAGRKKDSQ